MSADSSSSSRLRPVCASADRLSSIADARTLSLAVAGRGYTREIAGCLHNGHVLRCFSQGGKQSAWNKCKQSGNLTTSSSSNASKQIAQTSSLLSSGAGAAVSISWVIELS